MTHTIQVMIDANETVRTLGGRVLGSAALDDGAEGSAIQGLLRQVPHARIAEWLDDYEPCGDGRTAVSIELRRA